MPNLPSGEKRMRQYAKRNLRNRTRKNTTKTQIKKVLAAVSEKNVQTAEKEMRTAEKLLAKMAAKKTIHRNAAARKTSRLAKKISALKKENKSK